ncbi:MAG: phosphotransferase family protein [Propionibacterium sp.]|nr:phosphotransferase family protein [Propionibacterium sp.]
MTDELVPAAALTAWLQRTGLRDAGAGPVRLSRVSGGKSHLMMRVEAGERRWILRRPPKVAAAGANRGIEREYRILGALRDTPVPAPAPVALCTDESVLGASFLLMSEVAGVHPMRAEVGDDPGLGTAVLDAMVDVLVDLHAVDHRAAGLADFGRPEGFHVRQVQRWTDQLASYRGRPLDGLARVGDWLAAHLPPDFEPTIMHGDYHMRNVLAELQPARITAVLDWETSTIGDPLLDVAGLAEVWRTVFPGDHPWPGDDHVLTRYAAATGRPIDHARYYRVLYNFRLAVLLEGIHQRSLADPTRTPDPSTAALVDRCLTRATELIG